MDDPSGSGRCCAVGVLVAVMFPYATTASAAAEHVRQLEGDLAADSGDLATVSCADDGTYQVTTNHPGGAQESRATFWFLLFNALLFVPESGTLTDLGRRALARRLAAAGVELAFQRAVLEELGPDTSALFLLTEVPPGGESLDVLRRLGGRVHLAHPNPRAEVLIAGALYDGRTGARAVAPTEPTRGADGDAAADPSYRPT